MIVALDTNVLVYAEGLNGTVRQDAARSLISRCPEEATVIPIQVLGELFNVLVRKASRTRVEAREVVLGWSDAYPAVATSHEVMQSAMDLAADHQLVIWDAVIVSAASNAGCRLLLSEDLHDGFTWGGVTVVNPFASPRHALLDALLAQSPD